MAGCEFSAIDLVAVSSKVKVPRLPDYDSDSFRNTNAMKAAALATLVVAAAAATPAPSPPTPPPLPLPIKPFVVHEVNAPDKGHW